MVRAALAPQFRWRLLAEDPAARDRLSRELTLSPIVAQALVNRKLSDPSAARQALDPTLALLPDPSTLPDFEAGVATLRRAIEGGTPVLIHGDYDVDGTCGAVLLYRLLRLLDHPVSVFLPDRVRDGYSFGANSLAAIRERKAGIVIAVDNGTTAYGPLAELADEGVAVVVVDHHLPGPERPRCAALLNPWVDADAVPDRFPSFCGTGVAYLFAWGLLRELRGDGRLPDADRRFLYSALGLAAVATVGDVMPLVGPNRALVAHGLRALGRSDFPGLVELLRASGVRGEPTATDLGFRIGPRLNAAGRMGNPRAAFELLATTRADEARRLAMELEALNLERRETERQEALALQPQVQAACQRGDRVLFLGRSDAHFGVLGIVANRLLEQTGMPTLLWAECQPGLARGSARAPHGANLLDILGHAGDHFDGFGGHARAAGFHFEVGRAADIAAALRSATATLPDPEPPALDVDMEVGPRDLSDAVVQELARLAPFGEQNPEPLFLCTGLRVAGARRIGNDQSHVELRLERGGEVVRTLGWRMAERWQGLGEGDRVDAVFSAGINEFRGRRSVEWTLRDLRSAPS